MPILLSGLATATLALLGFGVAHALIITPIWAQLLRGAPFATIGGLALAWAFDRAAGPGPPTITRGLQFGAAMVLALVPATANDTALRVAGLRRADAFETIGALSLAAACGAGAGWFWTRSGRGAVAFAGGAVGLMVATAGPLPVGQSPKGMSLSIAIIAICLAAGIVLAVARRLIIHEVA